METIVYCLEILIRMARDSDFIVKLIFNCESLLESILKHFVPAVFRLGKLLYLNFVKALHQFVFYV